MHKYIYEGPVCVYGRCVSNRWYAETSAVSKRKAKANLKYQFTVYCGKVPSSKVELDDNYLYLKGE